MSETGVIVVGAGVVGSTLACLLGQAGLDVTLVEARPLPGDKDAVVRDPRVFAITRASERIFRTTGAWQAIEQAGCHAFTEMEVWDAGGEGRVHFDAAELGEPCLGYIAEPRILEAALQARLQQLGTVAVARPARFSALQMSDEAARLELEDGRVLEAPLLVAADGVNSAVREQLGIQTDTLDYGQCGLVALVRTQQPHADTARQRFLPGGPLAFLPMDDNWSSIVWTLPAEAAQQLLDMEVSLFRQRLADAFEHRLGDILEVEQRQLWPLRRQHATQYVTGRAALVGDAAHVIHPLAGQGVNLGLLDVAALAEVVGDARKAGLDYGSFRVLRRYERWRRGDNQLMMSAMDGFNMLFSNADAPLGWLRNLGLSAAGRLPPLRHACMRHVLGLGGDLPRSARPSP